MSRRELLTEVERAQLFGVPVDEASLARHYTLSAEDLELLLAKRGAHNILGAAVQLCLLRHPGFGLRSDEPVDDALRDDSNIALAVIGIRDDVNDHGIASSKAHAIEPGFLPLIGLADVAGDHLSRLVPGVALDAIGGHVAGCSRGCVAGAQTWACADAARHCEAFEAIRVREGKNRYYVLIVSTAETDIVPRLVRSSRLR